jgi:hypothetical protein
MFLFAGIEVPNTPNSSKSHGLPTLPDAVPSLFVNGLYRQPRMACTVIRERLIQSFANGLYCHSRMAYIVIREWLIQ